MDYKATYEKSWMVSKDAAFQSYDRNSVLPHFFPPTEKRLKVADIAGGAGVVAEWLGKQGYDVTLVEFSDVAVEAARSRGVTVVQQKIGEAEPLPFNDSTFDVVFFGDIIEHLFDPESALREVKRILKPGGRLIVSCPNIAYWRFRLYYLLDGDLQRVDVARMKPWEQEHIRFYSIKILQEFLGTLAFSFVRFEGVNTIWHSRLLVRYFPHLFAHTIVSEFRNNK